MNEEEMKMKLREFQKNGTHVKILLSCMPWKEIEGRVSEVKENRITFMADDPVTGKNYDIVNCTLFFDDIAAIAVL